MQLEPTLLQQTQIFVGHFESIVQYNTSSSDDGFLGTTKLTALELRNLLSGIAEHMYHIDLLTGEVTEDQRSRYDIDAMIGQIYVFPDVSDEDAIDFFERVFDWDMNCDRLYQIHEKLADFPIPEDVFHTISLSKSPFDYYGKQRGYREYKSLDRYFTFHPGHQKQVLEYIQDHCSEIKNIMLGTFWVHSLSDNTIPYTILKVLPEILGGRWYHLG